jgi:hypothetical protein
VAATQQGLAAPSGPASSPLPYSTGPALFLSRVSQSRPAQQATHAFSLSLCLADDRDPLPESLTYRARL